MCNVHAIRTEPARLSQGDLDQIGRGFESILEHIFRHFSFYNKSNAKYRLFSYRVNVWSAKCWHTLRSLLLQ